MLNDVECSVGMPSLARIRTKSSDLSAENPETTIGVDSGFRNDRAVEKERNRTAELAASSGGALALAVLINKALFPVRVPITLALTPSIARFLARRNLIKNNV
ncbi:UNVERIFIED_CONTAM: hypothetical protein Sradi_1439600 [Sesamum radiatum]|uniref:DUF1279 domain-containing protein n=1 Tax=Sesamum radiatum TaxID=300843 RepID=A0AAW2U608_SESRA